MPRGPPLWLRALRRRMSRGDYGDHRQAVKTAAVSTFGLFSVIELVGDRLPALSIAWTEGGLRGVLASPAGSDPRRLVGLFRIDGRPGSVHQTGGAIPLVELEQR